jgi:hypothetical protein
MYLSDRWLDYELLDAGDGDKLERWGDVILQRPDPQAIWPHGHWQKPDARYIRTLLVVATGKSIDPIPASGSSNILASRRLCLL